MGFIHVVVTNSSQHLKAKKKSFVIHLREMFRLVQSRDYIGIAEYMKSMLYKPYRPNRDKLGAVAATCAEIMESRARCMTMRLTMKNLKRETILLEMDPVLNTQFWSLFIAK